MDLYDEGEAETPDDPSLDDVDFAAVAELEGRRRAILDLPENDQPMANLGLLHEMYGDDLEVL